jgi:hypothetical protein
LDKTRIFSTLAAVSVLSLAGAPAHAQTFTELMEDIGLQKRKQEKMDFSERAPLVLPPSTDAAALPPPEDGSALATANPNWPNDPDTQAALDEAEKEKIPERLRRKYKENQANEIYKFQRQEREDGRIAAAGQSQDYDTALKRNNPVMTPDELKEVQKREAEAAKERAAGGHRRTRAQAPDRSAARLSHAVHRTALRPGREGPRKQEVVQKSVRVVQQQVKTACRRG